jgi:hypothetical protein
VWLDRHTGVGIVSRMHPFPTLGFCHKVSSYPAFTETFARLHRDAEARAEQARLTAASASKVAAAAGAAQRGASTKPPAGNGKVRPMRRRVPHAKRLREGRMRLAGHRGGA